MEKYVQIFCTYLANLQIEMDLKQLGCLIKSARLNRGMTQQNLGNKVGIDHSQISRIERGESVLISTNVRKLCDFLHISNAECGATPVGDGAEAKLQFILGQWPDSEKLICGILDSVLEAYRSQSSRVLKRRRTQGK